MFAEFLQKQIDYTINTTTEKFMQLYGVYNDKINMSMDTKTFDPSSQKIPIYIEGLYEKDSYINKPFLKLTHQTFVELHITPSVKCNIHFYHMKKEQLLMNYIRRIYSMLKVFVNNSHINYYNNTSFYIVLFNAPRIMSTHYNETSNDINIIGKKHYFNCTCGYASLSDKKNPFTICVTRRNGGLGLLVHEIGHICELDLGEHKHNLYNFPFNRLTDWKQLVKKFFNIEPSCKIGYMTEGINNGNSSIIHAMFTTIESGINKESLIASFTKNYTNELLHSIKQLLLLLKWFKYTNIEVLLDKNNNDNKGCKYTQTSMLLEYIFVRAIYLMNFSELNLFTRTIEVKDDKKYVQKFIIQLNKSVPFINDCLKKIYTRKSIISMEYYVSI